MNGWSLLLTLTVAVILSFVVYQLSNRKDGRRLPPGPRPKPIIGNLLDMPHGSQAQAYYTKLGKEYGPIASLTVFGTTLIIINDYTIAKELLDRRANNYSDRPVMQMLGELLGMNQSMLLEQTGDRFNKLRRIAHGQFGSLTAVSRWSQQIDVEVRRYLFRTLERPADFMYHLRILSATLVLRILYGYQVDQKSPDPLIDLAEKVADSVIRTGVPGVWLVDAIPVLKYIPDWFPGAAFKRQARAWHAGIEELAGLPFGFARQEVQKGTAPLSAVSETLKDGQYSDHDIVWSTASMFFGGSDTTLAVMEMLYLALALNPNIMVKAQEEIDQVVGRKRLVNEHDRARLPYTDALFKEVMRWEPLLEVNMPHATAADDQYEGYFIPKGALILSNTCGFLHDATTYAEPEQFRPERFLGEKPEMNPFDIVWGHGRRTCPGRHLAYFALWLEISRTIQVFDIRAVPGKRPERKFTWGVIRRPLPYETVVRIRSSEHEALVKAVEVEHPTPAHGSKL